MFSVLKVISRCYMDSGAMFSMPYVTSAHYSEPCSLCALSQIDKKYSTTTSDPFWS